MESSDERMIEVIREKPGIFAVGIADAINCEVCEVMPALQEAITAGWIRHARRLQPNGIMGDSFDPTVIGAVAAKPVNNTGHFPVRASAARPLAPTATEKALKFLAANKGHASQDEMRHALDLSAGQYPSSWLAAGIKAGQLHTDGRGWLLGPKLNVPPTGWFEPEADPMPVAASPADPEIDHVVAAAIQAPAHVAEIETVTKTETLPVPVKVDASMTFACAIWSDDGNLHMIRNGVTIAILTPDEVGIQMRYLSRFKSL